MTFSPSSIVSTHNQAPGETYGMTNLIIYLWYEIVNYLK
jgi:hypothetical protein